MKHKSLFLIMSAVLLITLNACSSVDVATKNGSIMGTWKSTNGLIEYKFENDGKMQLEALDIGSFKGTYSIKDGKITIEYNILVKKVKDTYNLKLEGNKMYLDNEVFTRIT